VVDQGWALSGDLPGKAAQAQPFQVLAELDSPVMLKLAFQFVLSGAPVCPLPYLQHSASKKQSSGLVLGSWVMASAEGINVLVIVDIMLFVWILSFF